MIGLHIMRPTSVVVAGAGSSASVRADGGVDFAAATSLSLNGVFTAAYDNYMISMRHTASVGGDNLFARLRLSGTDASGSNYVDQFLFASSTSVTGGRTTRTQGSCGAVSSTQRGGDTIYIYGPNLAQPTAWRNVSIYPVSSAAIYDNAATHSLSTAYDGITLIPGSGNITGMVTVYGYAQ